MNTIDQARKSHERAVCALCKTERIQISNSGQRRELLLDWKVMFHYFVRDCRRDSQRKYLQMPDPDRSKLDEAFDAIMEGLGHCRMLLWDENIRATVEYPAMSNELLALDSALKQSTSNSKDAKRKASSGFNKLYQSERLSWFSEQIAVAYKAWYDKYRTNRENLARMERAIDKIRRIKNGVKSFSIENDLTITEGNEDLQCPENWVRRVDDALSRITDLIIILEGEVSDDIYLDISSNNFSDSDGSDDSDDFDESDRDSDRDGDTDMGGDTELDSGEEENEKRASKRRRIS